MGYITGLVSVVIPTYKRSEMIMHAINSVLQQTYKNIELIVVNDNIPGDEYSKELYKKLERISDSRLIFIEQKEHINGAAARNCGIRAANGEYISFLDDDDNWEPEKIEKQVSLLKNLDESYGGVSCLIKIFKDNKLIRATIPYNTNQIMEKILSRRVNLCTGSVLMRRIALDECGYFDESLRRHQEVQLFSYFTSKYKVKVLKEYLYNVDISDGQNRPNVEIIKKIKEDFYKSVEPLVNTLSKRKKTKIFLMHEAELAFVYIKNKDYLDFIKCVLKMFLYPTTILYTVKLLIERMISTVFKNILIKKYRCK